MPTLAEASLLIVLKARDEAKAVLAESEGSIGKLGKAAATAGLAVGIAVAGIAAESIKMAGNFQKQMLLLRTEAGYSQADVERLSGAVLNLAPQVGKGPEELAMGLYHVASAGIPAANALDTLTAAAKLSSIGNADMESSTQAVLGVMAAYPEYAGHAMDATSMLNAIVGTGDMRMQQLAKAMATGILPAANTAKLGLIDVGASLATLTDNVTPADEAATRLRMTFALLQHQSGPATDALASIGIKAGQLGTDMVKPNGLLVAITDLKDHLGKTFGPETQGQTNKYLDILRKDGPDAADKYAKSVHGAAEVISVAFGGGRTSAAIQTLLGEYDKFASKYVALNKGTESFGEHWEATKQTFAFQMRALGGASDAFMIRLGSFLLPIATQVAKVLAEDIPKAAQAVGDWIGRNRKTFEDVGNTIKTVAIVAFQVVVDIMRVLVPLLGDLFHWVDVLKVPLGILVTLFVAWKTALLIQSLIVGIVEAMTLFAIQGGIVAAVTTAWTAAQTALDVALNANPIALAILAIAALIAVVVLIITHFQQFKDILSKLGDYIMIGLTAVINWLKDHWVPIVLFLLEGPFGLVLALIVTHMSQIIPFLGMILGKVGEFLLGLAAAMLHGAERALAAFWGVIKKLPGLLLDLLVGIPILIVTGTIYIIAEFISLGFQVIQTVIDWTPKVLSAIVTWLASLPATIWGFLVAVVQKFADMGNAVVTWASRAIPALVSTIVGFFAALPGQIGGAIGSIAGILGNAFSGALGWVGQHLGDWAGAIWQWFQNLPGMIGSWIAGLPGAFAGIGMAIIRGIASGISGGFGALKDALGGAIHSAVGALPGPLQGIAHTLGLAAGGIVKARPGGTVVTVAEGGEDEWVVPASKMRALIIGAGTQTSGVSPLPGAIGGGGGGGGSVVVQLMVDRQMLGQVVMSEMARLHRGQSPRLGSATG